MRDTIAFTRLPEESKDIAAIYVNDMGAAQNWAQPEPGTWTEARDAWFVIESSRRGGMGAPEAVPFSDEAEAKAFRSAHGGRLVRFDDIPETYVLGPVDLDEQPETPDVSRDNPGIGDNQGFAKVLSEKGGAIVGATVVGPHAGELIHELMYSVGWEALADEAAAFIHAHPTLSEAVGETLLSAAGRSLH